MLDLCMLDSMREEEEDYYDSLTKPAARRQLAKDGKYVEGLHIT